MRTTRPTHTDQRFAAVSDHKRILAAHDQSQPREMSRGERLREAVSAIFSDPEEAAAEFDKNVKDLTPRDAIHEIDIPMGPRFFWLDARQSFILGQYVGSVLLAGMSIEIAVRQFLERFFE